MAKKNILIITKEGNKIAISNENFEIDILECNVNKTIINKLNKELSDKYQYVVFSDEFTAFEDITHYVPVNWFCNCQNRVLMNEISLNPIIIKYINNLINERYMVEVALLLKHIIKCNIKIENFDFDKELENIRRINNCKHDNIIRLKNNIYKAIEQHYCQDSFFRVLKFKIKREKIVKTFLFKVLENINDELKKNTNLELVFKELISVRI